MTVNAETPIATATANGVTTAFFYSFTVQIATDLVVKGTSVAGVVTTYVQGVDYVVGGVGTASGSATFLAAPASGTIITMYRATGLARATDYQTNGDLIADTLDADLDRLWRALQDLVVTNQSFIRGQPGEIFSALPAAPQRANMQLLFDSSGNILLGAPVAGTAAAVLTNLADTSNASLGDALIGLKRTAVGAVATNLHNWIEGQVINLVSDFGADVTGAVAINTALAAALATGKNVYIGDGNFSATVGFAMSTPNQRVFGNGWSSRINFSLAASAPAITTGNGTGWKVIEGLYLNGVSNCSKMISIGSPDCSVLRNWIVNATATGHGVYLEDENIGSNTYCFDTRIEGNLIYGALGVGTYGIRLGTNHQGTMVLRNSVQNWGWHLGIVGATSLTTVMFNIFERSDTTGTTPAAIIVHKAGSGMPVYNVDIANNYFEQNQVILYLDDCAPINFAFHKNYCFRNTANPVVAATGVQATVYRTGTGTSAAAARIQVYDNYCDGFVSLFSPNNSYAANLTRTDNNTFNNTAATYNAGTAYTLGAAAISGGVTYLCILATTGNAPPNATYWVPTSYATGTYASSAYKIRSHNFYFGSAVASGAYASQATNRQEAANGTFRREVRWELGEYLESIQFKYLSVGSTPTINVTLRQVVADTDTNVASTGVISTNGIITLPINAFSTPGAHYYLEVTCALGGGTTAYFYPFMFYLR